MRPVSVAIAMVFVTVALSGCIFESGELEAAPVDEEAPLPNSWVFQAHQRDDRPAGLVLDELLSLPEPEVVFPGELPVMELLRITTRVSGEPTIGITRTGAIFYAAIDFDVPAGNTRLPSTDYLRSTDGGITWDDKSPQMAGLNTHPTSFDPYVYVDPTTGRVFAMDMGPHVACNKVSWSDDDGDTWMTREGACIPGANDHPTLFAGPGTALTNTAIYPNQVYLCTNQVSDSLCYQSPDGGLNWIATEPAFIGYDPMRPNPAGIDGAAGAQREVFRGLCGGLTGHGHASFADGTIYLGRDWCNEVAVAVSHDGGLTFDKVTISDDALHNPADHDVSVGTDKAGNAYAFWVGNQARAVYLATSNDQGRTWTEPVNVTAPGVTAVKLPSLVAGDEGRIAFQYVGSENPLGWIVQTQECETVDEGDPVNGPVRECNYVYPNELNNTTWNGYVGTSLDAHVENPTFSTVLLQSRDDPLKRGPCGGRCFGDKGGMYDFLDLEIDPTTGQLWSALVDVCTESCDGAGYGKETSEEIAMGAVARQLSGSLLLETPIEER